MKNFLLFIVIISLFGCSTKTNTEHASCYTPPKNIVALTFDGTKPFKITLGEWKANGDDLKYNYFGYYTNSKLNFDTILKQCKNNLFDSSLQTFLFNKNIYAINLYVDENSTNNKLVSIKDIKAIGIYYVNNLKLLQHAFFINKSNNFINDSNFTCAANGFIINNIIALNRYFKYFGCKSIDFIALGITEEKPFLKNMIKLNTLGERLEKLGY